MAALGSHHHPTKTSFGWYQGVAPWKRGRKIGTCFIDVTKPFVTSYLDVSYNSVPIHSLYEPNFIAPPLFGPFTSKKGKPSSSSSNGRRHHWARYVLRLFGGVIGIAMNSEVKASSSSARSRPRCGCHLEVASRILCLMHLHHHPYCCLCCHSMPILLLPLPYIVQGLGRKLLQSGHHYLVPKTSLHLPATSQSPWHGWINSIDFKHT